MLLVGLTGGLGSGKTFVGRYLESLGCVFIQADELGHAVLLPGGEAYSAVVETFGPRILAPDGSIDRRALGSLVFENPDLLARLNSLVHPAVRLRQDSLVAQARQRDPNAIVVVEAAILVETGSYKRFDRLIVTVCPLEMQIERAIKRSGLSRVEVEARLRRQASNEEKIRVADFVVDTSRSKEETGREVEKVYQSLRSSQS